jgi:hypothetical protein
MTSLHCSRLAFCPPIRANWRGGLPGHRPDVRVTWEASKNRSFALAALSRRPKSAKTPTPSPHNIADGYLGIDPSGTLIDKPALISRYQSGGFNLDTLVLRDIAVRACQDSAWESGTMELSGNLGEKRFSGTYRYSHFWVRTGLSWLIAGSQMTPV